MNPVNIRHPVKLTVPELVAELTSLADRVEVGCSVGESEVIGGLRSAAATIEDLLAMLGTKDAEVRPVFKHVYSGEEVE